MIGITNCFEKKNNNGKVPSEYQLVEYVTFNNNGTYDYCNGICTGIALQRLVNCTLYGEFRSTDTADSFMFACGTNQVAANNSGNNWIGWSKNATSLTISNFAGSQQTACTWSEATSGVKKSVSVKITGISANAGYLLNFGMWDGTNRSEWSRTASWYKLQILDVNQNLIFNGIPVKVKATGAAGIFDTISQTFLTSKFNNAAFVAGPNI